MSQHLKKNVTRCTYLCAYVSIMNDYYSHSYYYCYVCFGLLKKNVYYEATTCLQEDAHDDDDNDAVHVILFLGDFRCE